MKLWIIYKEGIIISKFIAEMLQDRLEDYIDVDVGKAKKTEPAYLVEEGVDYLIVGDIINKEIPNIVIQNWLLKYWEISKKKIKAISGYYIELMNFSVEPFWVKLINENRMAETIFPPILHLKLNKADLAFENGVHETVKEYSNEFIEYIINETNIN